MSCSRNARWLVRWRRKPVTRDPGSPAGSGRCSETATERRSRVPVTTAFPHTNFRAIKDPPGRTARPRNDSRQPGPVVQFDEGANGPGTARRANRGGLRSRGAKPVYCAADRARRPWHPAGRRDDRAAFFQHVENAETFLDVHTVNTAALLHPRIETLPSRDLSALQEDKWRRQWDYVRTRSGFYRGKFAGAVGSTPTLDAIR